MIVEKLEGPIGTEMVISPEVITPEEAERRLYAIWFEFASRPQTPEVLHEATRKREGELQAFSASLTFEARRFLSEETEVINKEGRRLTRGQLIQLQALQAAQETQKKIKAETQEEVLPKKPRKSAGFRKHVRLLKAQERRGTPPKLIR